MACFLGARTKHLTGKTKRLAVCEFCDGCLEVFFKGCANAQRNDRERLNPGRAWVAHEDCLQLAVNPFNHSVSARVIASCASKLETAERVQDLKQAELELCA